MKLRSGSPRGGYRSRDGLTECLFQRAVRIQFICLFIISGVACADQVIVPEALQQFEQQLRLISKNCEKSVVAVAALHESGDGRSAAKRFEEIISPESSRLPARLGMGIILKKDDEKILILTSIRLVEPVIKTTETAPSFVMYIKFSNKEIAEAALISADPRSELAVLRVEINGKKKQYASLASVNFPQEPILAKGSVLIAIGDPWEIARDGQSSLSTTVVSNTGRSASANSERSMSERSLHELGTLLSVDLPVRITAPGTPLFDIQGNLVGVMHGQSLFSERDKTVCYAIPISQPFQRVVREMSRGYEVNYGFLGISSETSSAEVLHKIGLSDPQESAAIVIRVPENSPAADAGLEREDVILRVNNQKIESNEDLVREVNFLKPGNKVELILYREGRGTFSTEIQLGKWPLYDDTLLVSTKKRFDGWQGLHVDFPTARKRFLRDRFLAQYPAGVAVTSVANESDAERAGLQVGQFIVKVNSQTVTSPQEFQNAINKQTEATVTLSNGEEILISETMD